MRLLRTSHHGLLLSIVWPFLLAVTVSGYLGAAFLVRQSATATSEARPFPLRRGLPLGTAPVSLSEHLSSKDIDPSLVAVIIAAASACTELSSHLARMPITSSTTAAETSERGSCAGTTKNVHGEIQKPMDVLAHEILVSRLRPVVAAMASEEAEDIIPGDESSDEGEPLYEIAFDPLDGSSNLDLAIPTGTIFGITPYDGIPAFSKSGRCLVAAGYALYSSSTELVISLGLDGCLGSAGFTLDPNAIASGKGYDAFVLTRPSFSCPLNGPYYSLNVAREPDWPDGLRRWVHDAKRGNTPSGTVFSARYVCSLCADVHRTLIKGGWAGNPRPHLRLLYEAAPLTHIAEAAGGKGSDGETNLLDLVPDGLHCRVPVFIGSRGDVEELEGYGDVRQKAASYTA